MRKAECAAKLIWRSRYDTRKVSYLTYRSSSLSHCDQHFLTSQSYIKWAAHWLKNSMWFTGHMVKNIGMGKCLPVLVSLRFVICAMYFSRASKNSCLTSCSGWCNDIMEVVNEKIGDYRVLEFLLFLCFLVPAQAFIRGSTNHQKHLLQAFQVNDLHYSQDHMHCFQ